MGIVYILCCCLCQISTYKPNSYLRQFCAIVHSCLYIHLYIYLIITLPWLRNDHQWFKSIILVVAAVVFSLAAYFGTTPIFHIETAFCDSGDLVIAGAQNVF